MSEQVAVDERRVARLVQIWLPIGTVCLAAATGPVFGVAVAVLVLGSGLLLGVVAILWASLRVLTGDVALPPEIEALDFEEKEGVDLLATKRKMMLLALKDLQNEHAVGKLDDEDFAHISQTYRANLKRVLKDIDAQLGPFRDKAEAAAKQHMAKAGVTGGYRGEQPAAVENEPTRERTVCAKCEESNEPDAKFCKGCGAGLGATTE